MGRGSTALVRVPPRVCLGNNLWQRFAVALRMAPISVGRLPLRPLSDNVFVCTSGRCLSVCLFAPAAFVYTDDYDIIMSIVGHHLLRDHFQ